MRSDDRLSIHRALSQSLLEKLSEKHPTLHADASYVSDLFSAIDADDNGVIDRDEFLQMSSESFEVPAQSARSSGH